MWKTWQKLINQSEKLVSYSSLIDFRFLLNDEVTFIAPQIRKLISTNHPFLKTAKTLISDTNGLSHLRGLLVLLISKTFNHESISINSKQRNLAEIAELAHAAIAIHKDIINFDNDIHNKTDNWKDDMQFGNKMATLCGDYLFSAVSKGLAEIENTDVLNMVSEGIGDTVESVFVKLNLADSNFYRKYIYLSSGSFLSKCCRAAVKVRSNEAPVKAEEEIAEQWIVYWCELYNICEHIDMIVQQLSHKKVMSNIFQSKNFLLTSNLNENLHLLHNYLHQTKQSIADIHQQFPQYNTKSSEILSQMTELLYEEAVTNCNTCRVFS